LGRCLGMFTNSGVGNAQKSLGTAILAILA